MFNCPRCHGTGKIENKAGDLITCVECNGTGEMFDLGKVGPKLVKAGACVALGAAGTLLAGGADLGGALAAGVAAAQEHLNS